DNRLSRLTRTAFLYTRRHLQALSAAGLPVRWGASGVLHLARDKTHEQTQQQVAQTFAAPDLFRFVDATEASRLTGWDVKVGGWHFPGGGWGMPPSLCAANLAACPEIRQQYGIRVERLEREQTADGEAWVAYDAAGTPIARADQVVLANAADARRLGRCDWLPLRSARGQTTLLPEQDTPPLNLVVCRLGYVTPAVDGLRVCGASFLAGDEGEEERLEEHRDNLAKLNFILPGFAAGLTPENVHGRVGFRPISPDRLPMLGAVPVAPLPPESHPKLHTLPRQPGLWLASGFGARGFVWSAWAGEFLASLMAGDPLPLEGDLADALDPARFLIKPPRQLRFGGDRE
ncbi:MAG TPA: FAD-dependent 5-carboxymethylaminomethyl-2-thiouridine(34) oxidoreductase MnmC, partial [Azospira sp.]|nr:FAD-dependent 5-carboxymethylaminomethyl-2-thiouridine(34) oxidoreductase MnmC [Azospira sp.]